jgi:2-polyprenyl-3-methyl-5-hydroxy-6-metoxy-1,4-benzoquinol methylase
MDRERLIDETARCPRGRLGHDGYGGAAGAPPGHEEVFDRLLARVGSVAGERVLDVGCGRGRLLERLLQAGAAGVAGVDHSPDVEEVEVGVEGGVQLSMARRRQRTASAARRSPGFRGRRRR